MLLTIFSNNFRPVDGSGARGNSQEAFNFLRNRYEGKSEARVRSLLAEMQSCTLQPGEDPDVYFARLYRLRLQLQQVGCTKLVFIYCATNLL